MLWGFFVVLSYALAFCLFALWWAVLRRRGGELVTLVGSAAFKTVMASCMFMPLLSLCLLSLIYGRPEAFMGFVFKMDLKSLMMFLLAPIPPIVALVVYVEAMRVLGMIKVDALKRITGLEGFASAGGA